MLLFRDRLNSSSSLAFCSKLNDSFYKLLSKVLLSFFLIVTIHLNSIRSASESLIPLVVSAVAIFNCSFLPLLLSEAGDAPGNATVSAFNDVVSLL